MVIRQAIVTRAEAAEHLLEVDLTTLTAVEAL